MKNRRGLALILSIVVAVALFAGCTPAASPPAGNVPPAGGTPEPAGDRDLFVGVVLMALNSDYWRLVQSGALGAGTQLGINVDVVGPGSEADIMGQIAMVEDMLARGIDALVLSRNDPDALVDIARQALDAGIPVVTIDGDISDPTARNMFIGTENYDAARQAGYYMANLIPEGSEVAIIRGLAGAPTHDLRQGGFQSAIEEAGMNVVTVQAADSDRALGVSVAENIMLANPNVRGIFATNDEMALGAFEAVRSMGKAGEVVIIGFDGSPDAINSIIAGELSASVAQMPVLMGATAVEMAVKILEGQSVPEHIPLDVAVLDYTNAASFMEDIQAALRAVGH